MSSNGSRTIKHSGINARLKPTEPFDSPLISIPLVGRRSCTSEECTDGISAELG